MKAKHVIAVLGILAGLVGGGAVYQISVDMSTNIDNSVDNSQTNISGDTVVNVDGKGLTCEELNDACDEANPQGALRSACNIIGILCPG